MAQNLSSQSLPLCPDVKNAVWTNLLDVPGLPFKANGVFYPPNDPKIGSFEQCETMGLRLFAGQNLLDNFVGIYGIKVSRSRVSKVQRRILERLAIASFRAFDYGFNLFVGHPKLDK